MLTDLIYIEKNKFDDEIDNNDMLIFYWYDEVLDDEHQKVVDDIEIIDDYDDEVDEL